MLKNLIISILIIFILIAAYAKYALSKFEYNFSIKEYKPVTIDLRNGAVINIILNLIIRSPLFFNVPVKSLYYEIYYNNRMIGRSTGASDFVIKKKGEVSDFNQSIDLVINRNNLEVAINYMNKKPTDFIAKVMVNVFGVNISLKKIKFTY